MSHICSINNQYSQIFTLKDGRHLGYALSGPETGQYVIYFHGYPGSRLELLALESTCFDCNIRMLGVDRPGFGLSSPSFTKSLSSLAKDIKELLDYLRWDKCSIISFSGGTAPALYFAQYLEERIINISLCGAQAPLYIPENIALLSESRKSLFTLGKDDLDTFKNVVKPLVSDVGKLTNSLTTGLSEEDQNIFEKSTFRDLYVMSLKMSIKQGITGLVDDMYLMTHNWGVDFSSFYQNTTIWHSNSDNITPYGMSKWLNNQLQNSKINILTSGGHYSLFQNCACILGEISE